MTWHLARVRIGALLAVICGAVDLPTVSHAQEASADAAAEDWVPKGQPVSLSDLIERARENPPAVVTALATAERFEAQEFLAKGAYLPKLSVGAQAGVLYNNYPYLVNSPTGALPAFPAPADPMNVTQDEFNALTVWNTAVLLNPSNITQQNVENKSLNAAGNATFDWALIDFSRPGAINSATAQKLAQRLAAASVQRTAIQAAVQLFARGLAAQMLIDDARLSSERRNDQLKSISALVRAGVRPAVDAQRAEIEAVGARHTLQIRKIEYQGVMGALAVALGQDPASPLQPVPTDHDPFNIPFTLKNATDLALQNRPEIKQAEALLSARQAEHRSALGMRLPVIGTSGAGQLSYTDKRGDGSGIDGRSITASAFLYLRWSAFDATVLRRAKVTSKAIVEAQKQFEATLLQLKDQVAQALYSAQIAKAQLDRANETLAAATTTRQAQNERYRAGVSTLLELLDAEEIEQNARRARIEASRDYDVARAALLSVCGTIDGLK